MRVQDAIFCSFTLGKALVRFDPSSLVEDYTRPSQTNTRQDHHQYKMPIVNGDNASDAGPLLSPMPVQDHHSALEVLKKEYPHADGIDVNTLLDSARHGGLTYNDFLVLPGYIGIMQQIVRSVLKVLNAQRFSCL